MEGKITVAGWGTGGPDGPRNSFAHRKVKALLFIFFCSLLTCVILCLPENSGSQFLPIVFDWFIFTRRGDFYLTATPSKFINLFGLRLCSEGLVPFATALQRARRPGLSEPTQPPDESLWVTSRVAAN
jgi:hypothetical protein